jgi:hypothetical protein
MKNKDFNHHCNLPCSAGLSVGWAVIALSLILVATATIRTISRDTPRESGTLANSDAALVLNQANQLNNTVALIEQETNIDWTVLGNKDGYIAASGVNPGSPDAVGFYVSKHKFPAHTNGITWDFLVTSSNAYSLSNVSGIRIYAITSPLSTSTCTKINRALGFQGIKNDTDLTTQLSPLAVSPGATEAGLKNLYSNANPGGLSAMINQKSLCFGGPGSGGFRFVTSLALRAVELSK